MAVTHVSLCSPLPPRSAGGPAQPLLRGRTGAGGWRRGWGTPGKSCAQNGGGVGNLRGRAPAQECSQECFLWGGQGRAGGSTCSAGWWGRGTPGGKALGPTERAQERAARAGEGPGGRPPRARPLRSRAQVKGCPLEKSPGCPGKGEEVTEGRPEGEEGGGGRRGARLGEGRPALCVRGWGGWKARLPVFVPGPPSQRLVGRGSIWLENLEFASRELLQR